MIFTRYQDFLNESLNLKEFILLVGPPGMGKSFYINKLKKKYDILNRDDIVIELCERDGLTYKDMYNRTDKVFDRTNRSYFEPKESDFYEEDGKRYLRNYEFLGEVIELPENSFMRRWSSEGFKKVIDLNHEVEETFNNRLEKSIKENHNIIIDLTNITKVLRRTMINSLKDNRSKYKVIAIIFNEGGKDMEDLMISVNRKRDLDLIKTKREKELSDDLLKTFLKNYEDPEKEEGIDEIVHVDTKKELENFLNSNKQS